MIILPFNKCILKNNFEFFSFNSTTSTMDEAKIKVDSVNQNLIILANEQTKGRGRRGNRWVSPFGNIYCSIALYVNLPSNNLFKFGNSGIMENPTVWEYNVMAKGGCLRYCLREGL